MKSYIALIAALLVPSFANANIPVECIQSPQRTTLCPHTLYRKAMADVPSLAIPAGDMVCLCLADLTDLPEADQPQAFAGIAQHYDISTMTLFRLLERKPTEWASLDK